ncbi:ATP synthase subunit I [Rheinheimera pleomorphica]|uniref:ATP synthase subunit I n=1 Tax=Rheinheimera pleomorphica TaxID=2703963 RepID=UPI00142230EF|nr:ATP synthase subunit I [Rheinheimera pleomorphica]
MTDKSAAIARKSAYKLAFFQLAVAGVIALAFFLAADAAAAKSAFKGGLVAAIANFVFALLTFRVNAAEQPELAKAALMRGHSVKMILIVVLCALVLQQPDNVAAAFAVGFSLTLLMQWSATFFFKH